MNDRIARHVDLSARLALMSDQELRRALRATPQTRGYGRNHVLDLGPHRVFVKRLPVTDREMEDPRSTRNVYGLPLIYNYGIGSAGMGVFRELAVHLKATRWVLSGATRAFPLLHHHRVMPYREDPITPFRDDAQRDRYVARWGGHPAIERFVRDREGARHELLLCLEHVPHPLVEWLGRHPGQRARLLKKTLAGVRFLHDHGIVHFDAHLFNLMTDGSTVFLCDFGLALDRDHDLTAREREFFEQHRHYDFGQVIADLDSAPILAYFALDPRGRERVHEALGVGQSDVMKVVGTLAGGIPPELSPLIRVPPGHLRLADRHRPVIDLMDRFYARLRSDRTRRPPFPRRELAQLLTASGLLD